MTALMFAAQEGHTKIVQVLLMAGADIHIYNNDDDNVLICAIKKGMPR